MANAGGLRRRAHWCGRKLMRAAGLKGEEGNSLVELAITLPLIIAVLMGTGSFAMAFYCLQELGNAVSGAAQELGATAGTVSDPCAQVVTQINASLPNLSPSNLTYTVITTDSSGVSTTYSGGASLSCKAAGDGGSDPEAPNEPQTVTVTYKYPWGQMFTYGTVFTVKTPTSNLTASSTTMGE